MPKKTFTPEQIVAKLRQIEVLVSQGKTVPLACKEAGIVDQTYYRWRKEYGGLKLEQAKKLKDLQKQNAQLRHAIADLTVEKQILRDIAEGNGDVASTRRYPSAPGDAVDCWGNFDGRRHPRDRGSACVDGLMGMLKA